MDEKRVRYKEKGTVTGMDPKPAKSSKVWKRSSLSKALF